MQQEGQVLPAQAAAAHALFDQIDFDDFGETPPRVKIEPGMLPPHLEVDTEAGGVPLQQRMLPHEAAAAGSGSGSSAATAGSEGPIDQVGMQKAIAKVKQAVTVMAQLKARRGDVRGGLHKVWDLGP